MTGRLLPEDKQRVLKAARILFPPVHPAVVAAVRKVVWARS